MSPNQSQNTQPQLLSDEELDATIIKTSALLPESVTDTAWSIQLTPKEGVPAQERLEDRLSFAGDLMRSRRSATAGYKPAIYVMGTRLNGRLVWEGAQHRQDGAVIFWSGELEGDHMKGTYSEQLEDGSSQSFTFIGTRIAPSNEANPLPQSKASASALPSGSVTVSPQETNRKPPASGEITAAAQQPTEVAAEAIPFDSAYQKAQTELAKIREQIRNLSARLDLRTTERDTSQTLLAQTDQERRRLETAVADSRKEQRRLESELLSLRGRLSDREAERAKLSEELRLRTQERDEAAAAKAQALAQGTAHESELAQARSRQESLEADLRLRTEERNAAEAALKARQDELQRSTQEGESVRERLAESLTQAQKEIASLRKERDEALAEKTQGLRSSSQLEQELSAAKKALKTKEEELLQHQRTLADSRSQTAQELSDLQNSLQTQQEIRKQKETELQQVRAQLQEIQSSLQAQAGRNKALLGESEEARARLERELREVRGQLQYQEGRAQKSALAGYQAVELESRLRTVQNERDDLKAAMAKQEADTQRFKETLSAMRQEQDRLRAQLAQSQRAAEAQVEALQQKLAHLERAMEERTRAMANQEAALSQFRQELEKQGSARGSSAATKSSIGELQEPLPSLQGERPESDPLLYEQLAHLEGAMHRQGETLRAWESTIGRLRLRLEEQQAIYASAQAETRQLLQALSEAQGQLSAQQEDQRSLQAEAVRLRAALAKPQPNLHSAEPPAVASQLPHHSKESRTQAEEEALKGPSQSPLEEQQMPSYQQQRAMAMELEIRRLLAGKTAASHPH